MRSSLRTALMVLCTGIALLITGCFSATNETVFRREQLDHIKSKGEALDYLRNCNSSVPVFGSLSRYPTIRMENEKSRGTILASEAIHIQSISEEGIRYNYSDFAESAGPNPNTEDKINTIITELRPTERSDFLRFKDVESISFKYSAQVSRTTNEEYIVYCVNMSDENLKFIGISKCKHSKGLNGFIDELKNGIVSALYALCPNAL